MDAGSGLGSAVPVAALGSCLLAAPNLDASGFGCVAAGVAFGSGAAVVFAAPTLGLV